MHEKTLLYGALGCTAIAAVLALTLRNGGKDTSSHIEISPVIARRREDDLLGRGPDPPHVLRRHGAPPPVAARERGRRGSARADRDAPHVREPRVAHPRGHVPHHAAAGRLAEPLRDEGERRVARGRGRREAGRAPRLRGLPPSQAGPRAHGAGRRQRVLRARVPDPGERDQGDHDRVHGDGRDRRSVRASAPRPAAARHARHRRARRRQPEGARPAAAATSASACTSSASRPAGDFVVEGTKLPRSAGLRSGDMAITRVVPFASSRPEPIASAVVLVDTSASRGLGLPEQARMVKSVLAKMSPDALVTVACFDQEVVPVYEGKAGGFGDKEVDCNHRARRRSARPTSSAPSAGPVSRRSARRRSASCSWATASPRPARPTRRS